jgi:hypothetical protein
VPIMDSRRDPTGCDTPRCASHGSQRPGPPARFPESGKGIIAGPETIAERSRRLLGAAGPIPIPRQRLRACVPAPPP